MADTTTSTKIYEDSNIVRYHITSTSDGTGETDKIIADKSALLSAAGLAEPASLSLLDIRCSMQGYQKLTLEWKHTSDVVAAIISSSSYMEDFGAISDQKGKEDSGSGSTGDFVVTTSGQASGASFDMTITLRKK